MTYPGTISLSRAHLSHLSDLLRVHRAAIRARPAGTAGALAHLRNGDTYAQLSEGFGIGVATVFGYVREAVDLLAARAPTLTAAMWRLARNGHQLDILDGTLVSIDRLRGPPTACSTRESTSVTVSTCRA